MKTHNLGYTPHYLAATEEPEEKEDGKKKKPPIYYPSFSIEDKPEIIKALADKDEITATVRIKKTGVHISSGSKSEYSGPGNGKEHCRIEFDILSIAPDVEDEKKEEEPMNGVGKALDSYLEKKGKKGDDEE